MVNSMTMSIVFGKSEGGAYVNRFRPKRLNRLLSVVDEAIAANGTCRILDIGGKVAHWQAFEPIWRDRQFHITLVNPECELVTDARFSSIAADPCDLSQFDDSHFDLVYSNSAIEYVGLRRDQYKM